MTHGESRRQALHAGMTLWIALLPFLDRSETLALAGAAVLVNWVVLPLTGLDRSVRRDGGPFVDGIKLYPIAVLILLVVFPLPAAAVGWAVMGVGDAASNLIGRRYGRPGFLGRQDRSLAGTLAFIVAATPAAALARWWVGFAEPTAVLAIALAGATAGALAELVPMPRWLDDNLPIALAAATAAGVVGLLLLAV